MAYMKERVCRAVLSAVGIRDKRVGGQFTMSYDHKTDWVMVDVEFYDFVGKYTRVVKDESILLSKQLPWDPFTLDKQFHFVAMYFGIEVDPDEEFFIVPSADEDGYIRPVKKPMSINPRKARADVMLYIYNVCKGKEPNPYNLNDDAAMNRRTIWLRDNLSVPINVSIAFRGLDNRKSFESINVEKVIV